MSKTIRLFFFALGFGAIIMMIFSFDLTWVDLLSYLKQSELFFLWAIFLWSGIYLLNTISWQVILNELGGFKASIFRLYKFTLSGFALNYVTPGGLNGGEPYRILELKQYVGTNKAVSSTILYSIAHIGSHILFWMVGALLLGVCYPVYLLPACIVIFLGALFIFLFLLIMNKGVATLLTSLIARIPFVGKNVGRFMQKNSESIATIDGQVRQIYQEHTLVFIKTIFIELLARFVVCFEVMLIPALCNVSFVEAYLVIAISSLMGNLLFFMPMQLGGREGGFVLAFSMLGIPTDLGLFVALLFRIRELILIVLGVSLIQIGNKSSSRNK